MNIKDENIQCIDEIKIVLIIGLGLMGASLAKALKSKRHDIKVIGTDNSYCDETFYDDGMINESEKAVLSIPTVEYALNNGIIDEGDMKIENIKIESVDLVVLSSPLSTYERVARSIKHRLKKGALVTDIGSAKYLPQKEMSALFSPDNIFIGGHPMRGSDKSGIQNSTRKIYDSTVFFITPKLHEDDHLSVREEKAANLLIDFIRKSGMRPYCVCAYDHDAMVAKTSHIPHIMAALMIKPISDDPVRAYDFIADGFKDTTRIAASNPKMWSDIFITNKRAVLYELEKLKSDIDFFIGNIADENLKEIEAYLNVTCSVRKDLNTKIVRRK